MNKLTTEVLKRSINKAYKAVIKEDKEIYKLANFTVCDGYVVKIHPDGKTERIKKAEFGYVKINAEDYSFLSIK